MDYLTVAEMAELKGCSIQYIQQYCKDGKIQTEQKLNCKGRMKYMIPVSSLPEDLQAKYYAKMKKDAGLAPELTEEKPEKSQKTRKALRCFEELSADERTRLNFWCELL